MSLVGNLQDLGLGEILQIVSLSRKSGVLSLSNPRQTAQVVFRNGQVIRAGASSQTAKLGEVLLQKGMVDAETLARALKLQAQEGYRALLGTILVERFGVDLEQLEEVVRELIENAVYSLFEWEEGSFEFELKEVAASADQARLDPLQFMLRQGLNPQYLAMEGTRILDERRHAGEGSAAETTDEELDLAFNPTDAPEPLPPRPPVEPLAALPLPEEPSRPLVLVDDDPELLHALDELLADEGYRVFPVQRSEDALIQVDQLYGAGGRPSLVVDLVMPRMDGTGTFGGLELMELVRNNFPDLPILGLSDRPDHDAQRRAADLKVPLLAKPGTPEEVARGDFGATLAQALSQVESAGGTGYGGPRVNIGDELRLELGEEPALPGPVSAGPRPIRSQLRGMLDELNNPNLGGGIILLVLRFAAQFMNRAVVLLVKREQIQGLGQFGIEPGEGRAELRVRNLKIPRGGSSLFRSVIEERFPFKGGVKSGRWDDYFLGQLGGGRPAEVFAGPIVSEGRVVALLYGDNLPDLTPIGDTDELEIFLSQAGLAMEKALLQRRLKEQGREEM